MADFKFGDFPQNRQFAKLNTSPKFPAIRYIPIVLIATDEQWFISCVQRIWVSTYNALHCASTHQ